jgi:hypothetical protein
MQHQTFEPVAEPFPLYSKQQQESWHEDCSPFPEISHDFLKEVWMIRALWCGKVALSQAFWGWAMLGNLLLALPFVWANMSMDLGLVVPVEIGYFALATYLFRVPYFPFTAVAVWRSAGNYTGRKFWPILAKGVTAGLSLIFLAQLLVTVKVILTSELSVTVSF